jgi:hypothetical protein
LRPFKNITGTYGEEEVKVKVKQYHYRPVEALRVAGV